MDAQVVVPRRSFCLDILAALFGVSSWISVNGLFVQLPLIVDHAPEGWAIASFLSVIVQMANVGPIAFSLLRWRLGKTTHQTTTIYLVLLLGVGAALALVFFWDHTAYVLGEPRSAGLLSCSFALSLVDCTSSVLFMPFMSHFESLYLNSYLIGEGLSGWIPATLALLQGVGGNPVCRNTTSFDEDMGGFKVVEETFRPSPNFGVATFFLLLFVMMLTSLLAFAFIDNCQKFKGHRVSKENDFDNAFDLNKAFDLDKESDLDLSGNLEKEDAFSPLALSQIIIAPETQSGISKMRRLLMLHTWLCLVSNGLLPAIMTYSCLPFGNTVYHLATALNSLANPTMAFLATFYPVRSFNKALMPIALLATLLSLYVMATALYSPLPMLGHHLGGPLVVLVWVLVGSLFSYGKVCVYMWCRCLHSSSALFACGAVTQLGSAIGAAIAFALVNFAHVFQQYHVNCGSELD